MGLLSNKQAGNAAKSSEDKTPVMRDRFIVGQSECYFEVAQYLTGKLDAAKVKSLFANEKTTVEETEGKSLKVMFHTGNEVKFIGFVTAGDASLELDSEDIPTIMEHATNGEIIKAIAADDLVNLF